MKPLNAASGQQVTAKQAAHALGVTLPTLYAYVSRGLLRSTETDGKNRAKLYEWDDVQRLLDKQHLRRDPQAAAEAALDWGAPLVTSELTLISEGRLYYRGQNVLDLCQNSSFEQVASLLWSGSSSDAVTLFEVEQRPLSAIALSILERLEEAEPVVKFSILLPLLSHECPSAYHQPRNAASGALMLHSMVEVVGEGHSEQSISARLASTWENSHALAAIQTMLILCADHELNASSFVVRCVASAGSNVFDAASAGLAALMGPKHGGATRRVRAMLREIRSSKSVESALVDRVKRGETIPGFGHNLYPNGDPRGAKLMQIAREECHTESTEFVLKLAESAEQLIGEKPNLDYGLVAACNAFSLPTHAPLTLFAIGRSAGWTAHAIEEQKRDKLIRPRARYVGPQPTV